MKTYRKLVSALLALIMLLSCMVGCAQKETLESPSQSNAGTSTDSPVEQTPSEGERELMKLSCYIGTGTIAPQDQTNNEYVKWIKEKFALDISETQFVSTGDPIQELGLMIASGTMPDVVCFWSDSNTRELANQFADAGMIIETEEMLRNSPHLMADLTDTAIDSFRAEDGKLYVIPSFGINPDNTEAEYTSEPNVTWIKRTDLFESLDLENPETPEDLYNILVTMKNNVQTVDGSQFIPLQAMDYTAYEIMVGGMFGVWTHRTEINEAEERFTQYQEFPEYVDFLKYMAKLYREGLVDPELFITESQVAVSRQMEGRVGVGITWPNDIDVLEAAAKKVDSNARYNAFPIPKAEGVDVTYYSQTTTLPTMITLISKDCKDPERAMEYLDWQCSTEGWIGQCYGAPGKGVGCWYEENGEYYYDQDTRDAYQATDPTFENQKLGGWTYFMVGRLIYHINHHGFCNVTESPDAQRMEAREYNMPETFMDTEWDLVQAIPVGEVESVKSVAVNKILEDNYMKIVMEAKDDAQVETMYADMMEAANNAGLQEILKERYERYQMYLNGEL